MLLLIWILLFILGVLFIIFSIEYERNPFWNLISITLSIPIWFILGLSQMQLEQPYQIFNSTSGNIETGIHTITSPISPYLTYLFVGIGMLMIIYLIAMVYDKYQVYGRR